MKSDLRITLIQSDLHWENSRANLQMFTEKIERLEAPADLIVLPEMFSTGFSMQSQSLAETMDGKAIGWMKEMAGKKNVVICGSLMMKASSPSALADGEAFFNRLIWMYPDGKFEFYDKRHLFGLGEEADFFSPGNKRLIVELNGWRILPLVCYDLRFPVWSRNISILKSSESASRISSYDLLIYVANWPEKRINAWKTLLEARAIENQSYVIGINRIGRDGNGQFYTGESSVIDPKGEILWRAGNMECMYTCSLSYQHLNDIRESLPFLKDADEFEIK